eukprot:2969455-Prymnesium_polylepis.1
MPCAQQTAQLCTAAASSCLPSHSVLMSIADAATACRFLTFCNDELLKDVLAADKNLEPVSQKTAWRWLHGLGFSYDRHKKGMYYDGHER